MVVAPGTADSKAHHGCTDCRNNVLKVIGALLAGCLFYLAWDRVVNSRDEESRGRKDVRVALAKHISS